MYRRTADTGCPDGPCPVMATDDERGTTALQGYDPAVCMDPAMGPQPTGENRIELDTATFESLLAQHLTDEAIERITVLRASSRVAV